MKRILSERNLVVILFITALTVFSLAREDAKKAEQLFHNNSTGSSLLASPKQTSSTAVNREQAEIINHK
jgi:hypothetical protein